MSVTTLATGHHRAGTAVNTLVRPLEAIGLVTAKDATAAEELMAVANDALALARQAGSHRATQALEAANRIVDAGKVDAEALRVEAVAFAAGDDITAIADRAFIEAVRRARELAFKRVREAPAVITKRFDSIRAEVERLSDDLAGVATPQQAIDRDLTAEWQATEQLRGEYEALVALVGQLRGFNLVATPTAANSSPAWRFRLDADPYDTPADDRSRFLVAMRRKPWVPDTAEQAVAVEMEWNTVAA